jgi:hypothetical protein
MLKGGLLAMLFMSCHSSTAQQNYSAAPPLSAHHQPSQIIAPDIPASVTFCGKSINLQRFDNRERMDRELIAFCYMHSATLKLIKKANRYFPIVEPLLKRYGVPDDFKYLMVIESNLNPRAYSRAGARGLWQFMKGTGREFGLEINKNIDERSHVVKSTIAACKYLKKAYHRFKDWGLVAISYNAGQGRIAKSLEKQHVKKATDLYLVTETSRYLFRILAAKIVFHHPQNYGFVLRKKDLYPPLHYKKIVVNKGISDLAAFAQRQGINYALLKKANPWLFDTFLMNKSKRRYELLIPTKKSMYIKPETIVPHSKAWVVD